MHRLLSTLKWSLITLTILAWLGLCVINQGIFSALVFFPGVIEFQQVPIALTLILPLLAAFAVFFVVGLLDQMDHFVLERELKKRIRDLEGEVSQLRNLPIREGLLSHKAVEEENRP